MLIGDRRDQILMRRNKDEEVERGGSDMCELSGCVCFVCGTR
jgi:hypothetical protein